MMKRMNKKWVGLSIVSTVLISGCQTQSNSVSMVSPSSTAQVVASTSTTINLTTLIDKDDLDQYYDLDQSIFIQLDQDHASCQDDSVTIDGLIVTINAAGVYWLTGSLNDGSIIVDASDAMVQLILDNVAINSDHYGAIVINAADKVKLTLASGSINSLSNGEDYTLISDSNVDGVIFSKSDLTINGDGTLSIDASSGHGIVGKDALVLTNGTYSITSAHHGIDVKDSVAITSTTLMIDSGKDGIHVENEDDPKLGMLYIQDGTLNIHSQGDGLSASNAIQIDDGSFDINTADGSNSVDLTSSTLMESDGFGGFHGNDSGMTMPTTTSETLTSEQSDSESQKGIKGEGGIMIAKGDFTIDSSDDCIHSGASIVIDDGQYTLSSGDDAIHSDADLTINNGTFVIPYCYEGIEGASVTINDGSFEITSSDDGINAAGGYDQSGFMDRSTDVTFDTTSTFIIINGGTITIDANGDGIDSNGALTINGGTIDVTSNGNGDTALDCDGNYSYNGGTITTNDGSESNPGAMGNGMNRGQRPTDGVSPQFDQPSVDDGSLPQGAMGQDRNGQSRFDRAPLSDSSSDTEGSNV